MFPSVLGVNISEKDNNNKGCIVSTNNVNCGLLEDLAKTSKNNNTVSSGTIINSLQGPSIIKRKRNLPGNPDPNAEVIALSPKTLLATNRFVCEVCQKGFQRDQNLQLHRRGHNLPWKLKQKSSREVQKKVYVCPEPTCVHHNPSRALGDLTGIKKHFSRKHGEKKWKCDKCSKIYAVQSDWKAHSRICGTKEYRCDCGTLFSRKDSFVTHRAFCDALAEETARISSNTLIPPPPPHHHPQALQTNFHFPPLPPHHHLFPPNPNLMWDPPTPTVVHIKPETFNMPPLAHMSATALLQKAATFGSHPLGHVASSMMPLEFATWQKGDHLTRDFLGLARNECVGPTNVNVGMGEMLAYNEAVEYQNGHSLIKGRGGFGFEAEPTWG